MDEAGMRTSLGVYTPVLDMRTLLLSVRGVPSWRLGDWLFMTDIVVDAQNMTKRHGSFVALKDVSLDINDSELFTLLEPENAPC